MSELRDIHERLTRRYGDLIEPFEVWENADALRMHWRPEKVKTILLAESHVFTTAEEADGKVDLSAFTHEEVPEGFVRLVYCLGYGENQLLDAPIHEPQNAGTWQFWKIFYSCLNRIESNDGFAPILVGGTPCLNTRIQNKLTLLQDLKEQGIWLLDASLAALYPTPIENIYDDCIDESLPYVRAQIIEANPERIIVVGKGVGRSLQERMNILDLPFDVLYQPQARRSAEEHLINFQSFYDLIHRVDEGGLNPMEKVRPREPISPSPVSGVPLMKQKPSRRWVLNGDKGCHHGRIRLDESPISLNLWFKENGLSDATEVGSFALDLHELLEGGYIRYDPVDSKGPNVRVRVVHGSNERFYVQVRNGTPRFLLN